MTLIKDLEDLRSLHFSISNIFQDTVLKGRSGQEYKVEGMSTTNNLVVIANLMEELRTSRTLEIGMAYGASTLIFCAMHSRLGLQNSQHIAIDPFQLKDYGDCGVFRIEKAQLSEYFMVHYDLSHFVLPNLIKADQKFDLIYIDGSHLFENVFLDFFFSLHLLNQGGIMLFDDSSDPHVTKVISFIRKNFISIVKEVDLSPYRLQSSNNFKYKLGKYLNKVQLTGFRLVGNIDRSYGTRLINF
jgi:predicted O-methyltransferase YrrM